jgi:23S rRNA pseudouridine1911/1915/1917 synthase
MPKPADMQLGDGTLIPILYEDRSVLAIDKPTGWMLVPHSWQRTSRNLQAAIVSAIGAGQFWARSRGLKFLRYVHRLDAETSGVLLFAKSPGALESYGALFESRQMEKRYLVVVQGQPPEQEWVCRLKLKPDPDRIGRVQVDERDGKDAATGFRVLERGPFTTLLEASPTTGRMHQIRVHLAEAGYPVVGDPLYVKTSRPAPATTGAKSEAGPKPTLRFGLRAVLLSYHDPFTRRPVAIRAHTKEFIRSFGFRVPWPGA